MGKSPGKWIKTTLFGKKATKSNVPKERNASKGTNEKETWIAAKEPTTDLPVVPPSISEPSPGTTDRNEKDIESPLHQDERSTLPQENVRKEENIVSDSSEDPERIKLEQAATKAQAAFRGYLTNIMQYSEFLFLSVRRSLLAALYDEKARRAFWVLRGIIRLQALIRGHLVRRQAVATLRCMQGIIKFQAVVRGRRVEGPDAGLEGRKRNRRPLDMRGFDSTSSQIRKLSTNPFFCKLLRSSPKGMPLRLQYGSNEPNSAWNWLERWTTSRFWEPLAPPKKVDSTTQSRQSSVPNAETEPRKSRWTFRKSTGPQVDNNLLHSTPEIEKPKRNFRKVTDTPVERVLEHPQNELVKVKRNLRKVSLSTKEATDRPEVETEQPMCILKKVSNSPVADVPENGTFDFAEEVKEDVTVVVSKEPDVETTKPMVLDGPVDVAEDDHPLLELPPSEYIGQDKGSNATGADLISKEDKTCIDNGKNSKRRASFPAKQEMPENGLQNTPKLPSYMAATTSAKAKLRGQGPPKSGQDVPEKNGFTRRHSLPSSTSGKLSSLSPRTQRPTQASGKAGTKTEKSLLSSWDRSDKVVQAGWRR